MLSQVLQVPLRHDHYFGKVFNLVWLYPFNKDPFKAAAQHVQNLIFYIDDWEDVFYDVVEKESVKYDWYEPEEAKSINLKPTSDTRLYTCMAYEMALIPWWDFMLRLFPNLKQVKVYDVEDGAAIFPERAKVFIKACPLALDLTFVVPNLKHLQVLHAQAQQHENMSTALQPLKIWYHTCELYDVKQYMAIRSSFARRSEARVRQGLAPISIASIELQHTIKFSHQTEWDPFLNSAISLPKAKALGFSSLGEAVRTQCRGSGLAEGSSRVDSGPN